MTAGFAFAQNATNGGAIGNNQSICPGETPAPLINITPASGGNASSPIQYLWMYGTNASFPGVGWQIAPGVNNQATYTPPAVGSTTYFIRCARRAGFTDFQAESNVVTINTFPSPFANINGASNTNVFAGFTYNLSASFSNNSTYAWDFNGDGFPDCFGQNCSNTFNTPGMFDITLTVTNNFGCTATTTVTVTVAAPTAFNIMDPCFCGNPLNIPLANGDYYNHDFIQINSNPGQTWTVTTTGGNPIFDMMLNVIPNGTVIPETSPGVYYLDVWFLSSSGGWSAIASNGMSTVPTGPGPGIVCPPCPNPLPVSLTSFEGFVEDKSVVLKWKTSTETDNDYFQVEASSDGSRFDEIAKLEGAGTVTTPTSYTYTDETPADGINYYRLKQVDIDGSFEYHPTITVQVDRGAQVFEVTPNPVRNVARIQLTPNLSPEAHIELISVTGQKIKTVNVSSNNNAQEMMMEDVPAGVYYVRLVDRLSNEVLNQKIIKQ